MALATFIENDYGSMAARELVYNTTWFEVIFLLLIVNFIGHIIRYKLYRISKLPGMIFHSALIIIIIGAGITRYFSQEGTIHLREGEAKNTFQTHDQYLKLRVKDRKDNILHASSEKFVLTPVTADKYHREPEIDGKKYDIQYKGYMAKATEAIVDDPNGGPLVLLTVTKGMRNRKTFLLKPGESEEFRGFTLGFRKKGNFDLDITHATDSFYIQSPWEMRRMSMKSRQGEMIPGNIKLPLKTMYVYSIKDWRIVVQNFSSSGVIKPVPARSRGQHTKEVMHFQVKEGNQLADMYLWLNNDSSNIAKYSNDKHTIELTYAPRLIKLPFKLKLNDFILERYPGSNTPSSYKSDVVLIDKQNNVRKPYMIYMNNVLKYKGYRFYQSSYEQDEKGSILSVNHDVVGMTVTYAGYSLLFLFIIISMLNKNSIFRKVNANYWKTPVKKGSTVLILILISTAFSFSQNNKLVIDKKIAEDFGKVLVQDKKGRTKPLYTLSNDILRKVNRNTSFEGYSSMQVFLGFYYDFKNWKNVPLIKVGHPKIKSIIGIHDNYAAFSDLVLMGQNQYKLRQYVKRAYEKPSSDRNKFDKKIMKVDERLNICFMMMTGDFLKIFPLRNNTDQWGNPEKAVKFTKSEEDSLYVKNIMGMINTAVQRGNQQKAAEFINSIKNYQRKYANYEIPTKTEIQAEVFYYKSKIFERLFPFYAIIGIFFLILLFTRIISGKQYSPVLSKIFISLIAIGFIFHTFGLGLRWYISGHAPMSNGYESMIFVSWITILAGFLFIKKSKLTLAATTVLASLTLMVAHLSFMDPEITNLVPVLKSYWLTLHVSIITGSYGFLGLGAILGLINIIFYAIVSDKNHNRIISTIQDLTVINYRALTIGLYLLTIGTFLGAIWANESWGRYWGWDPKETWSLITIIVYSFVIHARMIPGLKSLFSFNVLSLFGFSSVLMTYFGVNYYLSGLHSYAGGDPVPVPVFVYISVIVLVSLTIVAYMNKKNKLELKT
jgi:cytochrome c-type biogenesis protein CcsB